MAHSFIELLKPLCLDKAVIHEGVFTVGKFKIYTDKEHKLSIISYPEKTTFSILPLHTPPLKLNSVSYFSCLTCYKYSSSKASALMAV